MFDIGWSELLLIAAITIIVVGPKELPNLLRNMGRILNKVRSMSQEFRSHIDDAIKETEIDKFRDDIQNIKDGSFIKDAENFNFGSEQTSTESQPASSKDKKDKVAGSDQNSDLAEQNVTRDDITANSSQSKSHTQDAEARVQSKEAVSNEARHEGTTLNGDGCLNEDTALPDNPPLKETRV